MRCLLSALLAFAVLSSVSVTRGEEPYEKWMKFYLGDWTYEWKEVDGAFTERGTFSWTLDAKGKAIVGHLETDSGDIGVEVFGWDPIQKVLRVSGFSSAGANWVLPFDEMTEDRLIANKACGVSPDGRRWTGKFAHERKSPDRMDTRAEGTMDGKPFVMLATYRRKGTASKPGVSAMPAELRKQIDDHVIGEWSYAGNWGDQRLNGEERVTWRAGKAGVLYVGHEVIDGKRENYVVVMGWDGEARKLICHGFLENGETTTTEWTRFSNRKWAGQWMGAYRGVKSGSPATLEFKDNWQRYEDETDGKPWLAVFTRKTKTRE